ncbi:MAG: WecB/TagA/CpsF family glycosyltransferase [Deltaproteobacteria bacterium]|nr:WecB/TagA/CpsF family glycosyltransferase [Deltaproteobacteria bacterium]
MRILGSRVHVVDVPRTIELFDRWIEERGPRCRHVVATGFHGISVGHRQPDFRRILNAADLWIPDGIAPVWIARSYGWSTARRAPGADLMRSYFELANQTGYSSYFYGDTPETLEKLGERVTRQYPSHRVAGSFAPPFGEATERELDAHVEMINSAKPDVLWVALGLPKQERWISKNLHRLRVPIAVGVGAAFSFLAGTVRRAPSQVGDAGLEWLWRLAVDPAKTWRRVVLEGPPFVARATLERLGLWSSD